MFSSTLKVLHFNLIHHSLIVAHKMKVQTASNCLEAFASFYMQCPYTKHILLDTTMITVLFISSSLYVLPFICLGWVYKD